MTLLCPHCQFKVAIPQPAAVVIPPIAPFICEDCGGVSLFVDGSIREMRPCEMDALKSNPIWEKVVRPMRIFIQRKRLIRKAQYN